MNNLLNNPLFLIPLTTGLIFVVTGFVMLKFPPKKINYFYGYRTANSMKNQARWDFAQTYSAKEMIKYGWVLLLISLVGIIFQPEKGAETLIGTGVMIFIFMVIVIALIMKVEKEIKNKFGG